MFVSITASMNQHFFILKLSDFTPRSMYYINKYWMNVTYKENTGGGVGDLELPSSWSSRSAARDVGKGMSWIPGSKGQYHLEKNCQPPR